MAEEIAFENGQIYNFEMPVTSTLTLDRVIMHTVVHHSSKSTYVPNFIKIEEKLCRKADIWTFETGFIRSTLLKSRPKNTIYSFVCYKQLKGTKKQRQVFVFTVQ